MNMTNPYTNEQLAADYRKVIKQSYGTLQGRNINIKRIAESPCNIADFYTKEGSLANLTVAGIGKRTRGVLEEILASGPDAVIRQNLERKLYGIMLGKPKKEYVEQ